MDTSRSDEVRAQWAEHVMPATVTLYDEPLPIESAEGLTVTDVDGREYLDFFGGILTVSVGHGEPRVTAAVKAQIGRLTHISPLYPTVPMAELAAKLAGITPGGLEKTFFSPSGTEADECAILLAQVATDATEIIALRHAYSGLSMMGMSLTAHAPWRKAPSQVAAIKHVANPYCYRCPLGQTYPECNVQCARDIEDVIKTTTTGRIAGFIAEPIQGVGGFITPPPEYFEVAVEIVRRYGGLFICDEVQTGFGRLGETWFGIEQWGVEPEIMTMAKGIANGLPLGATIAKTEVADALAPPKLSTFGGNPVACAAANATIDVIEEDDLRGNAAERGAELRIGLERLLSRYPGPMGDVRGRGLMQAIEFVVNEEAGDRTPDAAAANRMLEEAREAGLLIGKGGLEGNVLRIAPPLSVSADQIAEGLSLLERAADRAFA